MCIVKGIFRDDFAGCNMPAYLTLADNKRSWSDREAWVFDNKEIAEEEYSDWADDNEWGIERPLSIEYIEF